MIKDQKNSIQNQKQQKKRITAKQKKSSYKLMRHTRTHAHTARQQEAAGKHTHCQWTPPSSTNQRPQKKFLKNTNKLEKTDPKMNRIYIIVPQSLNTSLQRKAIEDCEVRSQSSCLPPSFLLSLGLSRSLWLSHFPQEVRDRLA